MQKPTKKIYQIENMDCPSCAAALELDLEDAGINVKCNFANKTLEAEIEESLQEKKLKEIVKNSGYLLISPS